MHRMALPISGTDIKNEGFKKCGEIIAAPRVGKQAYGFCCSFCAAGTCLPFFSFDNFMMHMEEFHCLEFDGDFGSEGETDEPITQEEENVLPETCLVTEPMETTSLEEMKFSELIKDALHVNVPLDESNLSVLCPEHPKTIDVKEEEELVISETDNDNMNGNLEHNNDNNSTHSNEVEDSSMVTGEPDNEIGPCVLDRTITLAIIASYEKHRLLWDPMAPNAKSRRKHLLAFENISKSVNKELGLRLKMDDIRERIRKMRDKFRVALRSREAAKSRGGNYTPLWYYKQLEFLKTKIKYKPRNLIGARALRDEEPAALPLSGLTDVQTLQLIDIYKTFPCLWDVQHIGYRFQNQRQDALAEMLQAINNKMNIEISEIELQLKINRIRYACTQEKHRKLRYERDKEEFVPYCRYYEYVSFLDAHVGPFKCPFCEDIFNGADKYRIHKYKHDGLMPFTCPLCDHGFMDSGNYKVHVRRHTRDLPFKCRVCEKRYVTSTELNAHMRLHTGEKPFQCEICVQSFRSQSFYSSHMRRHQEQPNHQCTFCEKAFYERSRLKEHLKTHLNVRDKVCNICSKGFTTTTSLRQHKQIHSEKKKYACKICGKAFAQNSGLSGHMKSHKNAVDAEVRKRIVEYNIVLEMSKEHFTT